MARLDPHSYVDGDHPRPSRLRLTLAVDFDRQRLAGEAALVFASPVAGTLDLDTKGLTLQRRPKRQRCFRSLQLAPEEPVLGRRLRLRLPEGTREVRITYETAKDAVGLQWLVPEQTAGGEKPFLFSQCQAIHARTVAPLPDTPRIRLSYEASVTVPEGLAAVMSAGPAGDSPGPAPGTRTFRFVMPQPIPTYLLALAVGRLESRELSPRSRVWAEPVTLPAAAHEFALVEGMIARAEALFGPYEWDRYDMLVLPPAFPYGGMENPRMTFLTPTLIAGDRSLVDVVVHELAHSWTGNLVTNATIDHFWLNEGFTVWAERRILEALHGPGAAALAWSIGEAALRESLGRFGPDSALTRLRTDLAGLDPDDAFSSIPYEKGARFVFLLERAAGRERWDRFMRDYIDGFRFTSITTEEFLRFLDDEASRRRLRGGRPPLALRARAPGERSRLPLPRDPVAHRPRRGLPRGRPPVAAEMAAGWTPAQMLIYLQHLPRELDATSCAWLARTLRLGACGNHEILVEWLAIAAGSDYEPAFPRLREVLTRVGRMKYLRPLYTALGRHPRTRALAREVFATASPRYHNLSRRVASSVMSKYASDPP